MAPTRHSRRSHHQNGGKEAEPKAQETGKNDWGTNATKAFEFSVPQPMGSAREVQCPSATSGSGGEGTSGSVMFVPTATAVTNDTGDLLPTPANEPLQGSVMSLYNMCYSTLIAGLSVMAPSEDPDQAEEEKEGSSDNKCSVCERFKDNVGAQCHRLCNYDSIYALIKKGKNYMVQNKQSNENCESVFFCFCATHLIRMSLRRLEILAPNRLLSQLSSFIFTPSARNWLGGPEASPGRSSPLILAYWTGDRTTWLLTLGESPYISHAT
ncbi:hypothetical protein D623_10000841 [Myotis brandtii]|uniref:Uncharacterized protein n=1 Tax=Myotis brandtii TaxID=109478 RepID=S7NPY0_MYOBR|nr:hypothetical protein D623_10000841 [Myotis brandtii]